VCTYNILSNSPAFSGFWAVWEYRRIKVLRVLLAMNAGIDDKKQHKKSRMTLYGELTLKHE